MNYKESLEYISSVNWKGSVLGLERITKLLDLMGNPQRGMKFVHVAGTNGKGSTCAFLSSILTQAGYKTGLFTSPYIEVFNERMQINNVNISDEELAEITTYIRPFAESLEDLPTEFELNTAICFEYFKRNNCDIVVLEVGMGGEYDSTNVIESPLAAVITAIDLDHTAILGDTIEKIAKTKSGIIKNNTDVIVYEQDETVLDIIRQKCEDTGSRMYISEPEKIIPGSYSADGQEFSYKNLDSLKIKLLGRYQLRNAATALKVIEVLAEKGYDLDYDSVREGLLNTKWPGRFEKINDDPVVIVDGGHNPQGIEAAVETVKTLFGDKKATLILGILADKDHERMVSKITEIADLVAAVTPPSPRALDCHELAEEVLSNGVKSLPFESFDDAVKYAFAENNGLILAIGSLYSVADMKNSIRNYLKQTDL